MNKKNWINKADSFEAAQEFDIEYSVKTCQKLEEVFRSQDIFRPLRIRLYNPGTELTYEIKGLVPARKGRLKLVVEKFVGGGYAGQVYKVKALDIETPGGPIEGLHVGSFYALKILIPPKGFSKWFRNLIYAIGFQGPFSPQVNPAAARAGALWQKFIRRGARLRLDSEKGVTDILATFVDPALGSCGEISEWIDGRMWRFEVDDDLDARLRWKVGDPGEELNSPEYRAKRTFMARLKQLMHEMGAPELARQYEWWTCKSQPNALKRLESDPNPAEGYVAVDFRAGLALLPFLPMCPADFKLILQGIARGSLVQFDRGKIDRLRNFVEANPEIFTDMQEALEEIEEAEKSYRESLPDITHHHFRLIFCSKLWSSILRSSLKSWKIRNIIDEKTSERLQRKRFLTLIFYLLGLMPFLGKFFRKIWGRNDYRRHYGHLLTSFNYFRRALRAHIAETLIRWHRAGRVDKERTAKLSAHPLRFFAHLPLSILPAKMHRFFSDRHFFLHSLDNIFARPLRLYFKAEAREKWLREIVSRGKKGGMLTDTEASRINSQIKEPFIQKYLKSLAVHVCTLPVTQVVSVLVAIFYVAGHPEMPRAQAYAIGLGIIALFQVVPISPGSLVRGLYVLFLVIRERNFRDYNIAVFLGFFKYIGYLAFPIQMAYRYPDLARFMAGHWATGAVHIVPVFGEKGALLEHTVFDLFYNYPLTIRRRIRQRSKRHAGLKPRRWHVPLCLLGGTSVLMLADIAYFRLNGQIPKLGDIWWLALWIPFFAAAASSAWAGGAALSKRIIMGILCGAFIGLLYAISNTLLANFLVQEGNELITVLEYAGRIAPTALWRIFLFAILATIGTFIAETRPIQPTSTKQ
ncbi:MAG: hypothetical protein KAU46_08265 [Candidatus Aminicenantes bacterium]|nr:hypothetical protein [Candidatus Aminicenantes bacterium]